MLNQGETGVDCGGPCEPCGPGEGCAKPTDCESLSCQEGRCADASCADEIRNQGETGVDCGGPCEPCPSCDDGLLNQGETGVDCGGPCEPCPSCDDGIRNQEERLADCGGPCRPCVWDDYAPVIFRYALLALLPLIILATLYLLRVFLTSRFLWLAAHGKTIDFFYEDELTYKLVKLWNAVVRHLRLHHHPEQERMVASAYHELAALQASGEEPTIDLLVAKLRGLYAALLNLPPNFEYEALVLAAKRSRLHFTTKVILLRNTKLLYLMEKERFYTDASFALKELLRELAPLRDAF